MSEVTPAQSWVHGTVTGYSSYGCRCDPCRVAKSIAAKAYRERNADKIRAAKAAYYQANRAACNAKNQAWIRSQPGAGPPGPSGPESGGPRSCGQAV